MFRIDNFPKKLHWNMIFFIISVKIVFLFFQKYDIFSLDGKEKVIFLKKNTWKYDGFFRCSEKVVFLQKLHCNMIYFVISGKIVFLFSQKYDIFSLDENFLYICINVTNMILPFCQKSKDNLPKKYTKRWHFRHPWKIWYSS